MPGMIIMRGLPGSGKDTYIKKNFPKDIVVCSANDYFVTNGIYNWDASKLSQAHEACKVVCISAMIEKRDVVINNANIELWSMEVYEFLADLAGYDISYVDLFDGGCSNEELAARCVHGVSVEAMRGLRNRYMFFSYDKETRGKINVPRYSESHPHYNTIQRYSNGM